MIKINDLNCINALIEKDNIATLNIKGRIKYMDNCVIFADNSKCPNSIIVNSGHWSIPFASDDDVMFDMLKKMNFKEAGFSGVLIKYYDMIKEIYNIKWEDRCFLYYMCPENLNVSKIKHKVSNLQLDDAVHVNENYTYKGKNSLEVIKRCISERASSAVFSIDGDPISWVLIKDDGSMGIMYTKEKNRGNGLASSVSINLAKRIIDAGDIPFIHININNKASIALAESIGFKKYGEVMWFGVK